MRECGNLTTDRIKFDSTETILARSAAGLYRPATRRNSNAGDDRQASAQRIRPAPRAWGEASGSFPYLIALGLRPTDSGALPGDLRTGSAWCQESLEERIAHAVRTG
jgi:hypothetical protein